MSDDRHALPVLSGPVPLTRAAPAELEAEISATVASPVVRALLEAVDSGLLVLNEHRQIVAASLRGLVPDARRAPEVLGLRPGEALGCTHADEAEGGCGASEACRTCGALHAILNCQIRQAPAEGECLLTLGADADRSLELRLRATPLQAEGRSFTVLAVHDVGDEKRRRVLEQTFFHDLLNSLTGMAGWSAVLQRVPDERYRRAAERLSSQVRRLEAEIRGQRALLRAEQGTLVLAPARVRTDELLRALVADFAGHPLAAGRTLALEPCPGAEVETDPALVTRVLTNMVTNALEATDEGGRVRLWCSPAEGGCAFHVHNDAVIPRAVALRVFQRSFSTRARHGRGLGTYGMKLLGERYLGGAVSFVSREGEGTIFTFRLPERLPERLPRADAPAQNHAFG